MNSMWCAPTISLCLLWLLSLPGTAGSDTLIPPLSTPWRDQESFGKDWKEDVEHAQCSACIQGKETRLPSRPSTNGASNPADRIIADLWGPASTPSIGGSLYFLTCCDDRSRYVLTRAIKRKSDAPLASQHFINLTETQTGRRVKLLRTDQGGEFMTSSLKGWLSG